MSLLQFRLILILSIIVSFTLPAQINYSFEYSGNKFLEQSDLNKLFAPFNTFSRPNLDSLATELKLLYQNYGYFNTSVKTLTDANSEDTLHAKILFTIQEYEPAIVTSIAFNQPDSLLPAAVFSSFNLLFNTRYSSTRLEESIHSALNYYQDNGYPYSSISVGRIFIDTNRAKVNLYVTISPDNFTSIKYIILRGKSETNPDVIQREIRFIPGEMYNQSRINKIPIKLNKMKLFDNVSPPEFFLNVNNEGVLLLGLQDRNNNTFDGIIGYIPSQKQNESGYMTGFIDISFRNLFGTARSAIFKWQKLNPLSSDIEFSYFEPWVFNFPINAGARFTQIKQDTTYISWSFEPRLEFNATDQFSIILLSGYQRTIPALNSTNILYVFNSTKTSAGLAVKFDSRDDPFVPLNGIYFKTEYSYIAKKINNSGTMAAANLDNSYKQQSTNLSIGIFTELMKQNVLYTGLTVKTVLGDLIEVSDYFQFGGTNTLRGYRENQFMGQKIAYSTIEYRIILEPKTYAFTFFDAGVFQTSANSQGNGIANLTVYKQGYGAGLNFQTGLGIMNVSYALAAGESFSQGKIHFGLKNEF